MLSTMILPALLLLAGANAQSAFFYSGSGCGGDAVAAVENPGCGNQCITFSGGAVAALLTGTSKHTTTCSVYTSNDCTGNYQSVGSHDNSNAYCTALGSTSYSAHCYYDC